MNHKIEVDRSSLFLERIMLPTGDAPPVGSCFSAIEIAYKRAGGETLTAARLYHNNLKQVDDVWIWDAAIGEGDNRSYYMRFDRMSKAIAWLLNDPALVQAPYIAAQQLREKDAITDGRLAQIEDYLMMAGDYDAPPLESGVFLRIAIRNALLRDNSPFLIDGCAAQLVNTILDNLPDSTSAAEDDEYIGTVLSRLCLIRDQATACLGAMANFTAERSIKKKS